MPLRSYQLSRTLQITLLLLVSLACQCYAMGTWIYSDVGVAYYSTAERMPFSWTGDVRDGKVHGQGVQQFYSQTGTKLGTYEGDMYYGFRQGFGTLNWSGYRYSGEWQESLYHGQGTLTTASYWYKGEFKNGKKDGYGIWFGDEIVRAGTFVDDVITKEEKLSEGYFIIGLCSKSYDEVAAEAGRHKTLGFTPAVIYSSHWSNLAPGYYMVVYGVLKTTEDVRLLDDFKMRENISFYIKHSGEQR